MQALTLLIISCILAGCYNNTDKPSQPKHKLRPIINRTSDTILIVSMNLKEQYLLPIIGSKVKEFYHLPVKYEQYHLPKFAYYSPRKRFKADSLITYLQYRNNGRYRFVAGLTSADISTTLHDKADFGIFGLGTSNNKGCITSTFRLKKGATQQKLIDRVEKVVLHEVGHNNGLKHCTTPYPCFMKDANKKIQTVDAEPKDLCKPCKRKVQIVLP